eukprot:gene7321-11690_t
MDQTVEDLSNEEVAMLKMLEQANAAILRDDRAPQLSTAGSEGGHAAVVEPELTPLELALRAWGPILPNIPEYSRKNKKRLAELVRLGVPGPVRGIVWQRLAEMCRKERRRSMDRDLEYAELLEEPSSWSRQITADIARTFPSHPFFTEKEGVGQHVLFNVIKAYSCFDQEVGYCQGSAFIVALLLMHMPEEEAFNVFCILMRDFGLRSLFRPTMSGLTLRLHQFECLVADVYPELHAHFTDMMIPTSSYASQWFLTLFGSALPLPCVERLFDLFVLDSTEHGLLLVFRCGLAILGMNHEKLLQSHFDGIMATLHKQEQRFTGKEDALVEAIVQQGTSCVTTKKLAKYEKDWAAKQEAEQLEQGVLMRTRQERDHLAKANAALTARLKDMESEMQGMATKLVEKTVELSEAEEQIDQLKAQLADNDDDVATTM